MPSATGLNDIAHVIQLSVAPVFLLSGIGAMLGVLTNRLSRAVDRARKLEADLDDADEARQEDAQSQLLVLSRRAWLISMAISLCTACALLICMLIVALFLSTVFAADLSLTVAGLFVAAMLAFIGALLAFLREVYLATNVLRIGPHHVALARRIRRKL